MTVAVSNRRADGTGNGATNTYSYGFRIRESSDLEVVVASNASPPVEANLVLGTDYTVTGVNNKNGGTIVLVNVGQAWMNAGYLIDQYHITILGNMPDEQDSSIRNLGPLSAAVEDALDNITMLIQQIGERVGRAITLPKTAIETTPQLDSSLTGNAGRTLVVDPSEGGFSFGPTVAEITASASAAATSATAAEASEENASTSAGTASTEATAAAVSAGAAAASASAAAASVTSIAAAIPVVTGSRAAPIAITAVGGISFTGSAWFNTWYIQGSGMDVTITANPRIAIGNVVGQRLRLIVPTTAGHKVILLDTQGLDLGGEFVGELGSSIDFEWDGTNWFDIGRRSA